MKTIEIGRDSGVEVPVLGLGTYHVLDKVDEPELERIVEDAVRAGVTLIDTSDNYMNEGEVGSAVARLEHPDDVFIATKTGLALTFDEFKKNQSEDRAANASPERVKEQVEWSKLALGRSCIDLYLIHAYDNQTSPELIATTMNELVEAGDIARYGVSNYRRYQLEELLEACDALGVRRPSVIQPMLNMLTAHPENQGVDIAHEEGITVFAHSPLMKGYLADRFVDRVDVMLSSAKQEQILPAEYLEVLSRANGRVQELRQYANWYGYTLSELAISWLANQQDTVVLNSCVKSEHLESSLWAADLEVGLESLALIDEVRQDPYVNRSVTELLGIAEVSKPYYRKRTA